MLHVLTFDMWKVNLSTWHEPGSKKKSQYSTGFEPMTSRTPAGALSALSTERHGFDSCWELRFFLCPTLVSCWWVHLSLTEPKNSISLFTYYYANMLVKHINQIGVSRTSAIWMCFLYLIYCHLLLLNKENERKNKLEIKTHAHIVSVTCAVRGRLLRKFVPRYIFNTKFLRFTVDGEGGEHKVH